MAIAKTYKHLGDTSKAMYYMDYACAVAQSAGDKTYIADCWAVPFNDYKKSKFWSSKAVAKPGERRQYTGYFDIISLDKAKTTTTMDRVECPKQSNTCENLGNKNNILDKTIEELTHPQYYLFILHCRSCKEFNKDEIRILRKLETFLENATQNNIPKEHLGYLWLDCAERWKNLGEMDRFEECTAKSDVVESQHRAEHEYDGKHNELSQHISEPLIDNVPF